MKIRLIAVAIVILASNAFGDSIEHQIAKSLAMWDPSKVEVQGETLSIISKERRVTDQIYFAMIGGICMGTLPKPNSLDGISEIRILNQFGRQGYVFEGGKAECEEINNMPIDKTKIFILGLTHTHTNK